MADELFSTIPGSVTNYAIIRRASDGYAADDAADAFEAWADGSIDDYDIPLTSQGGDYYTADFPTWITAGTYDIIYYVQAGATPATTDDIHASERLYWNGSSVSSSPSSDYLTTLARVKLYGNITSSTYDSTLTNNLGAASRFVERYTQRWWLSEARTEYYNGRGTNYIQLYGMPVTLVSRIATCPDVVLEIRNTSTSNSRAVVSTTATALILKHTASAAETTTTLAFATYTTITTLAAAVNAIGSGWVASVQDTYGIYASADIKPIQGALDALQDAAEIEMYVEEIGRYRTNTETGMVSCNRRIPSDHQNVEVRYTSGYAAGLVPDDVQQAVCAIALALHNMGLSDQTMESEKIGDYSYKRATSSPMMMENFLRHAAPSALMLLDAHRLPGFF
jgi:hypothetical protein